MKGVSGRRRLDTQDAALGSTCNIQILVDLRSTTLDLFLADTAGNGVELWSSSLAKIIKDGKVETAIMGSGFL